VGGTALRCLGLAVVTGLAVALAGGGEAFWLAIPAALLLTARGGSGLETLAAAGAGGGGAAVPALAAESLGPLPSLPLAALVLGASVAVMHRVRSRLDADRVRLQSTAVTDPLTGLVNRRALLERVDYEVARHARAGHRFAVVAIDLDGFKLVNDRFGHAAGDEVLADVAAALRSAVRDQDTAARVGGDEFCVLAPETDATGADRLAARIRSSVASATGGLRGLSASVGSAIYPADGPTAAEVLEAADARQIAAKRNRRREAAALARRAA
jgi:two-component system, cell cycle response regulator